MTLRPTRTRLAVLIATASIGLSLLSFPSADAHRSHRDHVRRAGEHRSPSWRSRSRTLESRSILWERGATARVPIAVDRKPVTEVRALWVVRNSIETPAQIGNLIATAKRYGFNTLFVQVRGRGDAYYDSSLEPRAEDLAGEPASFDPLKMVIDQAHAAGIQVHAWANMCYVWSAGRLPKDPNHIVNAHTDWLARDEGGGYRLSGDSSCEGAYMAPSNQAARQHLHDVILDIVNNYDVDGIHFDYIRYPNADYDRSAGAESAFADTIRPNLPPSRAMQLDNEGPAAYVRAFPDQWADWRRDQITSMVEWISKDVKTAKPWVCVSAAVFANYDDAYNARGQDWKRWLRDGAIDAVVPMAYASSTALVDSQIRDAEATAHACGRACYAGLGSWHISAASTLDKIMAARADGAQGIVLFSYGGVTDDGASTAYLDNLVPYAFAGPATLPQLASVSARPQNSAMPAS